MEASIDCSAAQVVTPWKRLRKSHDRDDCADDEADQHGGILEPKPLFVRGPAAARLA
jgi:hypothetical protein